jgi:hypothetical protein
MENVTHVRKSYWLDNDVSTEKEPIDVQGNRFPLEIKV